MQKVLCKNLFYISFGAIFATLFTLQSHAQNDNARIIPPIIQLLLDENSPPNIVNTCTAGLIKDINPGSANSLTSRNPQFTQVGNQVFFRAETASHGMELWVTDGSSIGTRLVKDIKTGTSDSISSSAEAMLTAVGDHVLFAADSDTFGIELWKSDGTTLGTQIVKDVRSGSSGSSPQTLTHFNGKLYYFSTGTTNFNSDEGLWLSDGTSNGTQLIKDTHSFNGNTGASTKMAVLNNQLIFRSDGEIGRQEPWVSDGTPQGTHLLKDIASGNNNSEADGFTTIGNKVFFFADDGIHGMELWVTDGSSNGTFMVKDIRSGSLDGVAGNNFTFNSTHFLDLNGSAVFLADDGIHGNEFWISDGTAAGTRMIRDIAVGSEDSTFADTLDDATVLNGKIYFEADANNTVNSNREIWVSDGTSAGTMLFTNLESNGSSAPEQIFSSHGLLFLSANGDSNFGRELWIIDEMGRTNEMNIDPNGSSSPEYFFNFNGQILFFADTGALGIELWSVNCDFNLAS